MATRTAAAGGGNWSVGSTWVGGVAPTAADDAVLNATSGNVTIDNTSCVCRSLDCNGYTGTLTMAASRTLTIGDGTAGTGNRALRLVAGMTFVPAASSSQIRFASTSGTQQTIALGGKTLGNVTFQGAGSSYLLSSALTMLSTATLSITAGTVNTGGQTVSGGSFTMNGSTARTLTLGASTVTMPSAWTVTGSNVTFNCGSSSITTGSSVLHTATGSGLDTFHNLTLNGANGAISVAAGTTDIQFENLTRTGTAAKTCTLQPSVDIVVIGTLTVNGNSATDRVLVRSPAIGTALTITAANVAGSNADFRDITGAGASSWDLSAMTGGSGDCGGNTGITFTTPISCYAVGITGAAELWSTHAWMTASGGATPARVPLPQDNAVIDANSGSGTKFTLDMPRSCKDLTWDRPAMEMALSVNQSIYGSLTITSALSITGAFIRTFEGRGSHTIDLGGVTHTGNTGIDCVSGTYTLAADAEFGEILRVVSGNFDTDNFDMTSPRFMFSGSATRSVTLGTSTMNMTGYAGTAWDVSTTTNLTFSGEDATLRLSEVQAADTAFQGGGFAYGTLDYTVPGSGGDLYLNNFDSFDTINFTDGLSSRGLYLFTEGTLDVLTAFNVSGAPGVPITVSGVAGGADEVLNFLGAGVVSCDWLTVADVSATPADTWYAGENSTSVGVTTGWIFDSPGGGGEMLSMIV